MYPLDEQETTATFDPIDGQWTVYSCIRKHITKLLKIAGEPYWKEEESANNGDMRIIAGKWKLSEKQLKFAAERSPMQLSDEERAARAARMLQGRT